jgi:maltooligosyltrehalose trehalohydrolase
MKRRHDMPFGAECLNHGVRFRLWAPAARQVELCIEDNASKQIPLESRGHGWFELTTREAGPGTRYRFRIDGSQLVPDPASRFQPNDVHGPSEVIDAEAFNWQDSDWRGRPWEEAVIYELHVGAFTREGKFSSVRERLDHLAETGVTALELMPLADFPGKRNWGYDGVFTYAPDSVYGRPEDLKELVQAAHQRGMMVLLDVVYNHFGPEGNYLNVYAPQFFTPRHHTPWGNAINFDGAESRAVRDFFIHNALYWLNEFHFDGLRLDAVHAIIDDSKPDILTELAGTVRKSIDPDRHVHLILEHEFNCARHLRRGERCQTQGYTAQWNDDIHHALHVLITGEKDGYYTDYSQTPLDLLGRCLTEGFAFQGEASLFRNGQPRGETTTGLPPGAFISFLQNHDQVGNRAFGERIATIACPQAVRAAEAILLLAPFPPMLFMGEEFGTQTPFLFFCDFEKGLAEAIAAGRRNEFARFTQFSDPTARAGIPDPNAASTFEASQLDWKVLTESKPQEWLRFYRQLLNLRCRYIVPLLAGGCSVPARFEIHGETGLSVEWEFANHSKLTLLANLGAEPAAGFSFPDTTRIYSTDGLTESDAKMATLPDWSVAWFLES